MLIFQTSFRRTLPPFSSLHHQLYDIKTIVRYFDISLVDIIKIISVAKLDKRNYPIWNTQNSINSASISSY